MLCLTQTKINTGIIVNITDIEIQDVLKHTVTKNTLSLIQYKYTAK